MRTARSIVFGVGAWILLACLASVSCSHHAPPTSPAAPLVFAASRGTLIIDLRTQENAHVTDARVLLVRAPVIFESAQVDSGEYAFSDVPTGAYRLRIWRIGYRIVAESVYVQPGTTQTIRRQLQASNDCDIGCNVVIPSDRPWWRRWLPF